MRSSTESTPKPSACEVACLTRSARSSMRSSTEGLGVVSFGFMTCSGMAFSWMIKGLSGAAEERDDRPDQEDDEKDLRDAGRGAGEAAEAEDRGVDRDDQEKRGGEQPGGTLGVGGGNSRRGRA